MFNMSMVDWGLHTYHTLTFRVIWSNFTLKINILIWKLIRLIIRGFVYLLKNWLSPIYIVMNGNECPKVHPIKETLGWTTTTKMTKYYKKSCFNTLS